MNTSLIRFAYRRCLYVACSFLLLSSVFGMEEGKFLFETTLASAERLTQTGAKDREISDAFLFGAGKCRDLGAYEYAIDLFSKAIQRDPSNVNAYRVYGDFLMGYRGLYELAAENYAKANNLLSEEKVKTDEGRKKALERSIQILHRDGRDGYPIFQSERISLYLEPFIGYREPSADPLTLFSQKRRIEEFFLNSLSSPPPENIDTELPRRLRELEQSGRLRLRFAKAFFPYLQFSRSRVDIDSININIEDIDHPFDGEFNGFSTLLGKNFLLRHNLDLTLEGIFEENSIESEDPFRDVRIARVESRVYSVDSLFTYYFSTNTFKFGLRTSFTDFDRLEGDANAEKFDDTSNSQTAKLRLSFFKEQKETDNPPRFRGRRSTHYEVAFSRIERITEEQPSRHSRELAYRTDISVEELGLLSGYLDLNFGYTANISDRSRGPSEGHIDRHQLKFTPVIVTTYELYSDNFFTGLEFLSFDFPFDITYGENDGDFDRYRIGMGASAIITTPLGFRLFPKIKLDYAYFPDIDRDDIGLLAEVSLRY